MAGPADAGSTLFRLVDKAQHGPGKVAGVTGHIRDDVVTERGHDHR